MENIGNLIPHRLGPIRTPWDELQLSYGIFSDILQDFWIFFFMILKFLKIGVEQVDFEIFRTYPNRNFIQKTMISKLALQIKYILSYGHLKFSSPFLRKRGSIHIIKKLWCLTRAKLSFEFNKTKLSALSSNLVELSNFL